MLWRLIKFLLILVILAGIALIAFAYAGPIFMPSKFAAPAVTVTETITLEIE